MTIVYRIDSRFQRINRLHCSPAEKCSAEPQYLTLFHLDEQYCSDACLKSGLSSGILENKEGGFMTPHQPDSWEHLATQASKEMDPETLMNLIDELNGVLGEREETSRRQQHQGGANLFRAAA